MIKSTVSKKVIYGNIVELKEKRTVSTHCLHPELCLFETIEDG